MQQQLKKVLSVTIAWIFISLVNNFIGLAAILDSNYIGENRIQIAKEGFWDGIYVSISSALLSGIIGGSVLVFIWEKWLRTKPYGWTLRNIFITYIILFNIISIPTILLNNSLANSYGLFSAEAWSEVVKAYQSPSLLVPFFFWMMVVLLTLIAFLINDKYGPGVFRKFLLGKYFSPTKEERIFMFLDLRSSTTIAEKLGEERYFNFIRYAFELITPAILKNGGEIYQYVGDEIVVSWEKEKGIRKSQFLDCFFDTQKIILDHRDKFLKEYSVIPEFKAGVHYGHVMAGEIGVVKREIAYSGDVLNTTARIQSKCNELGVNILISGDLLAQVSKTDIRTQDFGFMDLKGKAEQLQLYGIEQTVAE